MIDVPYFAELAATKVFEEMRCNPRFAIYLPDLEGLKNPLNRQYLFNVRTIGNFFSLIHLFILPCRSWTPLNLDSSWRISKLAMRHVRSATVTRWTPSSRWMPRSMRCSRAPTRSWKIVAKHSPTWMTRNVLATQRLRSRNMNMISREHWTCRTRIIQTSTLRLVEVHWCEAATLTSTSMLPSLESTWAVVMLVAISAASTSSLFLNVLYSQLV